ncbi:MAG: hypothetical protein K6F69_01410, partial [Treponema sp.]|nr:hypothetical protein [Treponema sp.]
VLFAAVFTSCSSVFVHDDYTIENKSSKTVSFTLQNYSDQTVYTLESGESIEKELYSLARLNFVDTERVYYTAGNDSTKIYDSPSYTYTVINTLGSTVTLSETNGLLGDTSNTTIDIPTSTITDGTASSPVTVTVYTTNPEWYAAYKDTEIEVDISQLSISKD